MAHLTLGDSGDDHPVGDEDCPVCWSGFPIECQREGCSGLIHASFGDENADCEYWLYYGCDECGDEYDMP